MLIIYLYMVIIKMYRVKKISLRNFLNDRIKFSAGNFRTHNPSY